MPIVLVAKPETSTQPTMWQSAYPAAYLLANFIEQQPHLVRGKVVMDLGTGSGYLAIAAALAGARKVIAVDRDAAALQAVMTNAAANDVGNVLRAQRADITNPNTFADDRVDIFMAADAFYNPAVSRGLCGQLERASQRGQGVLAGSFDDQLPRLKRLGNDISNDAVGPNGKSIFVHAAWVAPQCV